MKKKNKKKKTSCILLNELAHTNKIHRQLLIKKKN